MAIPGSGRYTPNVATYGAAPPTPEEQAFSQEQYEAQQAAAYGNVANSGSNIGSLGGDYTGRSLLRSDQTNAERVAQQQSNFNYAGFEGGADAHAAMVRNQTQPIAGQLGMYGDRAQGEAMEGSWQWGQGMDGLYEQAASLNNYAAQGPGASVAQAQLDANTAMAMRGQLALAGSGRGQGGGASQFRQAAANQAQIAGQANAASSMLQAQEAQDWRQAQMQAYSAAGSLYGQGAQQGGTYAQGMGQLATGAQQGAGQLILGQEGIATDIYGRALTGTGAYESNLTDTYAIDKNAPRVEQDPGLLALGLGVAGGVAGTYFGGPAGGAGGAALGYELGKELE